MTPGPPVPVTVVTITRNDLAGLRATVASLARQTLRPVQHVVVDGGSQDGSMEWFAAHRAFAATTVISEPDDGIYDAMNKGMALATGELIAFLNSGDVYLGDDVLARAVEHHRTHGWEWGHGLARVVDADGRAVRPLGRPTYAWARHAFGRNDIVHQSVFVETEVLRSLGAFDRAYPIAADFLSILQLGRRGRPGLWDETDVAFLVGGLSDRRPERALWDMHRARSDLLGWHGPVRALDACWWGVLVVVVRARRTLKQVAARVAGPRAVDWWASRRAGLPLRAPRRARPR